MSDERTGRELTPHDGSQPSAPVPAPEQVSVDRFSAGPRAHSVGLTEERGAQIVKQSGNARMVALLAFLVLALFIPVYWFWDLGVPALGVTGRMETTAEEQFVTDVERGYALYLANCARCHSSSANESDGLGGVGPALNSQPKLYNTITKTGGAGKGHLNPNYLHKVLDVGGRYVCGDANSVMPAWLQPNGPLNYREVEELIAFITASNEVSFTYDPHAGGHGAAADADATPYTVTGWRDPNWVPAPGASPPPACWRNPSGQIGGSTTTANESLAPIANPGTVDAPRSIPLELTGSISIADAEGAPVSSIAVKAGETIQFEVTNTGGIPHNFYIGPEAVLSKTMGDVPDGTGIPQFTEGTETLTWTVPADQTEDLQFACTVPGHYGTMHGNFVIQP